MHIVFLNPQGNFDHDDTGWTEHPDFGGQLVYVKEVAIAMAQHGHKVDIITRQIISDPRWKVFSERFDSYPDAPNVRILRLPCGPTNFLPKEELWPHLPQWVDNIADFYKSEGSIPEAATGHYGDGGLAATLLQHKLGIPFTLTGHSLGAQKLDKFIKEEPNLAKLLAQYHFDKRLAAERLSMAHASRIIVSTAQERFEQYSHRAYQGAVDSSDDLKFAVIPPRVNLSVFGADRSNAVEETIARKVEAMLERDIPASRRGLPLVICSSRLERKKNHLAMVQAWAQDDKLRQSANLAIILRGSDDPLRQRAGVFKGDALEILNDVVKEIDSHDLWPCITAFALNSQAELAACYRYLGRHRRGIFCLTALYEPFGLAPLEAMAAGLAAAVTKNGGPAESMQDQDGQYGVLVDPEDPKDIARGLYQLSSNEETWRRFQKAGMRRVDTKYTWTRTAEGYLKQISDSLKGEGRANTSFAIPEYFSDARKDDIDEKWLRSIY